MAVRCWIASFTNQTADITSWIFCAGMACLSQIAKPFSVSIGSVQSSWNARRPRMHPSRQQFTSCSSNRLWFRFEVPTVYECNEHGLLASLYDAVPFVRDGICLLHKEGHYIHGPSELSLLWKDLTCSRYLIETDMHGNPTEHQCITLRLGSDYKLYTGDDPPLQFCKLENCQLNDVMHPDKIQPGRLMKFHLEGDFDLQSPCLEFVGLVRNRRKQPDLFSKILFQRQAREGKIHSLELIQTVKHHG